MSCKKISQARRSIVLLLPTLIALTIVLLVVAAATAPAVVLSVAEGAAAPAPPAHASPTAARTAAVPAASLAARAAAAKNCSQPGATCSCQEWTFAQPTWNLTDFYYRASFEFPSPDKGDEPVPRGYVSFVVRNRAVPYGTVCLASSNATNQFFYGDEWYACDQGGDGRPDKGPGLTWFRYDKTRDMVEVKQSWQCSDQGRVAFQAVGQSKAVIECKIQLWENTDWKNGETYQMETTDCWTANHTLRVPWAEIIGA